MFFLFYVLVMFFSNDERACENGQALVMFLSGKHSPQKHGGIKTQRTQDLNRQSCFEETG